MEAEYLALNTVMRALIPLIHVPTELAHAFDLHIHDESSICTVFQNNQAALTLATQNLG